jgi:hypothetical protein
MNYHWYYFSWFRDLSRSSNMINRFVLCMLAFSFKLSCQKLYTSLKRLLVIELLFLKASIILRKYIYLDDCSICYNNKFLLPVATHGHDASSGLNNKTTTNKIRTSYSTKFNALFSIKKLIQNWVSWLLHQPSATCHYCWCRPSTCSH